MNRNQVLNRCSMYKFAEPGHLRIHEQGAAKERRRHITLARSGEGLVVQWLKGKGWRIIDRNWRAGRYGEVDIVARDPDGMLVFVEVKTRRRGFQAEYDTGLDSIDSRKRRKIVTTARLYMSIYARYEECCRFDVVVVRVSDGPVEYGSLAAPIITHVVDAFAG